MPNEKGSAVVRVARSVWVSSALLCACRPSPEPVPPPRGPSAITVSAPAPALPSAPPKAEPASTLAAELESANAAPVHGEDQFLVVSGENALVLRTRERVVAVLARSVQTALYDSKLELVWVAGEALRVVDLRRANAKPISIVREWPGTSSLTISHPASTLTSNEACDVGDSATLDWKEQPTLRVIANESRQLRLESKAWLRAELARAVRPLADPEATDLRYEQPHVALPDRIAHCLDAEECGKAVRFGAYDLQLVLAVTLQGDCWHPYCVFRDPKSGAFSSPTLGEEWQGTGYRAGPCGPYYFDRSGKSFLVGDRLCKVGEPCQSAGGYVLGWRVPGVVVGTFGDGSMAPDRAELEKMDAEREQGE
jgi:hypothetical protein